MADKRIILNDGKAYVLDMSVIRHKMFEMLPMTIPAPASDSVISFQVAMEFAPKIMQPGFLICNTFPDSPSPWKFAYLFPLGKKAFVRR